MEAVSTLQQPWWLNLSDEVVRDPPIDKKYHWERASTIGTTVLSTTFHPEPQLAMQEPAPLFNAKSVNELPQRCFAKKSGIEKIGCVAMCIVFPVGLGKLAIDHYIYNRWVVNLRQQLERLPYTQHFALDEIPQIVSYIRSSIETGVLHLRNDGHRNHTYLRLVNDDIIVLSKHEIGSGGTKVCRFAYRIKPDDSVEPVSVLKVLKARRTEWSEHGSLKQRIKRLKQELKKSSTYALEGYFPSVPDHDCVLKNGKPYFITQYFKGSLLDVSFPKAKALPKFIQLMRKTGEYLLAALNRGIVHRDIKPGNILIAPNGNPCIADLSFLAPLIWVRRHALWHLKSTLRRFGLGVISQELPGLQSLCRETPIPRALFNKLQNLVKAGDPKELIDAVGSLPVQEDGDASVFLQTMKTRGVTNLKFFLENGTDSTMLGDHYTALMGRYNHLFQEMMEHYDMRLPPTPIYGRAVQKLDDRGLLTERTRANHATAMALLNRLDGVLVGTPGFHPLRARQTRIIDTSSDIFAFGRTLLATLSICQKNNWDLKESLAGRVEVIGRALCDNPTVEELVFALRELLALEEPLSISAGSGEASGVAS